MILDYEKMKEITIEFYQGQLGVDVNIRNIDEYIHSLSLPGYCKVFNRLNQISIIDNNNLATLGDGVLGLCICKYFYDNDSSMSKHLISTMKIKLGCNEFLNEIGLNVLHLDKYLFKIARDLEDYKAYATAVESIIGCLYNQHGFDCVMDFFVQNLLYYMK